MKIGIYNPYLDSLGGGERYMLTLAGHLSKEHDVNLFWNDASILTKAEERFSLPLGRVDVVPNIFGQSLLSKLRATSTYDFIIMLSDGSIPLSWAKHNILHFQVPFAHIAYPFWKKKQFQAVVCNSEFTKRTIDKDVGDDASVIYPPVPVDKYTIGKKTKTILSVGRFSSFGHAKKQDVLIDAFQKGIEEKIYPAMKLILAGGLMKSDEPYYFMLKERAKGLPVEFFPNCPFDQLKKLYEESLLYWHAAGFGEEDPTLFEHFGISTVEAMASGAIPIVYDAGGQSEIVIDGECGYVWQTIDQLLTKTSLVLQSPGLQQKIRDEAKKRSDMFNAETFNRKFDELILKIQK